MDVCDGDGHVRLGQGRRRRPQLDVNSFNLEDANLTVRAGKPARLRQRPASAAAIVPGFFMLGTGRFLASSNGPVVFVEPPFRADPEALLGWAECPSPS